MGEQQYRLPRGGQIDRAQPVTFSFDGTTYSGFVGDTLASALLANGVHMVGRSFKYHRPRGIVGAGSEDPAALVQVYDDPATTVPNTRATELEIFEGLAVTSQNCWPSLKYDVGAVNDLASRFFSAGFYYKTFMGPPFNWMFFEPFIRKAAGLGESPEKKDPDRYETLNRHCDVLVVGAGPAGLMAARAAGASGARVILVEETAALGGQLLSADADDTTLDGKAPAAWVAEIEAELADMPEVTVLKRTCAFGYYSDNFVMLHETVQDHLPVQSRSPYLPRQRTWRVRAQQVVLATGAIERPLVFHQNDRPGIMLASAVQTYLNRYGVEAGRRAVVFTSSDSAYQTAFDLEKHGVDVTIIDTRSTPPSPLRVAAQDHGLRVMTGATITGTTGSQRVNRICVRALDDNGDVTGPTEKIDCDLIATCGGWSPNVALFSQSRGKLRWDEELVGFRPAMSWQRERSAGAADGVFPLQDCLAGGAAAGAAAASDAGFTEGEVKTPDVIEPAYLSYTTEARWEMPSGLDEGKTRAFIDLQNDVTAKDLHLAVREGFCSVEHAKRYTTTGMATDQGKTVSVNAFGILSEQLGKSIPEVGVTTYRQPFKPVTFGAIAGQHTGELFHPRRTTAMHDHHVAAGATFELVGDWMRARNYPQGGETFEQSVQRESKAARTDVGMLDASTLGKIDIRGKDAAEFLNRIYSNAWLKLKPGMCRYGLMLNEDGMVFDDGVTARLGDHHFHMTTTTGGAARVLNWLEEYHQTEWSDLEVYMTSVTEQWAVASICGPKCANLLSDLASDIDLDADAFPFMAWREADL
ncbi:MAG: 2Fe-2S iron-sulfur cluster-binding protein, partial [Pseudomonadota bacterium]